MKVSSTLGALASFALVTLAHAQQPVAALWTEYAATPNTHANIPNCSYAGYHYGDLALPNPANNALPDGTVLPVVNVRNAPFNATGNGVTDDTAAIKAAIAAVGPGKTYPTGAVIYFPNGIYCVSDVLRVTTSKTILRGQSQAGTVLKFLKSLGDIYRDAGGNVTKWPDGGGLVWFEHASNPTVFIPDWSKLVNVAAPFPLRGAFTVTLSAAPPAWLVPGLMLNARIQKPNAADVSIAKHLLGDTAWGTNWFADPLAAGDSTAVTGISVNQVIEVASVDVPNKRVTFKQPLRFDMQSVWTPILLGIDLSRTLSEVGIETMTLKMNRNYEWFPQTHRNEVGWNGVQMTAVIHGFVRDVTVTDPDGTAFSGAGTKCVTWTGCTVNATGPTRERFHHGFSNGCGYDNLVENSTIDAWTMHGLSYDNTSMGCAYSNLTVRHGVIDCHRMLPYENLFTQIRIMNDGIVSGPKGAGPNAGARQVFWNIDGKGSGNLILNEAYMLPRGALVGIRGLHASPVVHPKFGDSNCRVENCGFTTAEPNPPNLYLAQKALRLGQIIPTGGGSTPYLGYLEGPYTYEFAGTLDAELQGQDGWVIWDAWADQKYSKTLMSTLALDGTASNGTRGAKARAVTNARVQRTNDRIWSYVPFRMTETSAAIQFDARTEGQIALSGNGDSLRFGLSNGAWSVRGGSALDAGSNLAEAVNVSTPANGGVSPGEWITVQLAINFAANGNQGTATLYYKNRSRGQTTFTAVNFGASPVINMNNGLWRANAWTRVETFTYDGSQVDNIVPNVGALGYWENGLGLTGADIVPVGAAGSTSPTNVDSWSVVGSGRGINAGTGREGLHFAQKAVTGDCTIIARIDSMATTDGSAISQWARAGVMIRESAANNARFIDINQTPTIRGIRQDYRDAPGANTVSAAGTNLGFPAWLKIVRVGSNFKTYQSANGTTWTQVGTPAGYVIPMASTVCIGLISSNNSGSDTSTTKVDSRFSNVVITTP